jgi:hypothetical protein
MWARDILIVDRICHPGETIRRFRCIQPSNPISVSSNAVLVQLQGEDKFGKLHALTLMHCYRVNIQGNVVQIDIRVPSNILRAEEIQALRDRLKREYPKAFTKAETQAVLAMCRILEKGRIE